MRRRYQVRARALIPAPVERVFDVASDPALIPLYADEIDRIDLLRRRGDGQAIVRSWLRLFGMKIAYRYRYRYRRPRSYSGVQAGRALVRGYFIFSFRPQGQSTVVQHVEGLESAVPGLALLAGTIYFRLLGRGDLRPEVERLAQLVNERFRKASSVAT